MQVPSSERPQGGFNIDSIGAWVFRSSHRTIFLTAGRSREGHWLILLPSLLAALAPWLCGRASPATSNEGARTSTCDCPKHGGSGFVALQPLQRYGPLCAIVSAGPVWRWRRL